MFTENLVPVTAGLGVAVVADAATCGVWDSTVLIAFLTVTVPLLVGQYVANKRKTSDTNAIVAASEEIAKLRKQLGIPDDAKPTS